MNTESVVAAKYARALFALAKEKNMAKQVQDDLIIVAKYFAHGDGQDLLAHPLLPVEKKMGIVKEVLQDRVSPLMFSFLQLIVEKRRGQLVGEILKVYEHTWLDEQNRSVATVSSAIPLSKDQLDRLQKRLSKLYNNEVELQQVVDPALQAGARIDMGDLVLDGTLQARLARLRRAIHSEN